MPPYIHSQKNKIGDIFLLGQNKCISTGVKKSYFGHTFHLRRKKKFSGDGWRVGWGGVKSDFSVSQCPFLMADGPF